MKQLSNPVVSSYFEKITVAGNIITVRRYEHLNVLGGGAVERPENGEGACKDENYKKTQKKRREAVRNLCTSNFDNQSKFVTLTFRDGLPFDIKNVKACNVEFNKFIKRLKYRHPELKYLAVIEFQDKNGRGAVHYHVLCNLPYVKKSELAAIWGLGFVKINRIENVDNVGAYVSKYMAKDLDDTRLQGLNAYQYSRNLEKPIEVTTWRESDSEIFREVEQIYKEKSPSYAATYESEKAGKIQYFQYNLAKK